MAAVKALLSLENAELDGDVIKGLDKQIKDLKADTSVGALFGAAASGAKFRGAKPDESGDRPPKGKDVNNMSYEELCAYMEANPENTVIN